MYPEGFPGLAPTSRTKSLEEFTSSPALIYVMVGNATLPPLFTRYTLAPHDANSERGELEPRRHLSYKGVTKGYRDLGGQENAFDCDRFRSI